MSLKLKQIAVSTVLKAIRALAMLMRGIWWLIIFIGNPFVVILKFLFKPLALFFYRWYLKFITTLRKSQFMQSKILFLFGNKYFIHVIIVIITFFVASTNILQAKETQDPNFGMESGLYKIVNPDGELGKDIVEEGLIETSVNNNSYVDTDGLLVANISALDPDAKPLRTIEQELQQLETKSGTAFVSSTALETETGIRADFVEYKIKDGDSVGSLANRYRLTVNSILWANNLTSQSYIKPGDILKIPPYSGYPVEVKDGDTLQKLVEKHKGNFDETLASLDGEELIPVGSQVIIIDGEPYIPPPPPKPTYYASSGSSSSSGNIYQNQNVASAPIGAGDLNWPVGCRNSMSTYWGHGLARDIACPSGTPIYAAHSGTASVQCGGSYCGGYGNYITVSGDGYRSLYAHMSAFNISGSQYVNRGDVIGFVGSTGRSTGPHLHIEIWIGGAKYDPINLLR
ncbi:MAG: peptidoglycan DD-metalloendopeptidase family protein [bacterium]|nr:peptidoglycan DD-metalloendopeptidase family protein [bacterium]